MTDDHAAHRLMPGSEPPPAADTMISPAGLRIRELERELASAVGYIGALTFAASGVNPGPTGNEAIDGTVHQIWLAIGKVAELEAENARLRRALDAAGIVRGCDPLLPRVAVEPWDVGEDRDYGF